jgi:hypothetical protein
VIAALIPWNRIVVAARFHSGINLIPDSPLESASKSFLKTMSSDHAIHDPSKPRGLIASDRWLHQVAGAAYVFEARTIQRMELLVLSRLDWRLNLVTPFCYLHYLIRSSDHRGDGDGDGDGDGVKQRSLVPALRHSYEGRSYPALLRRIKDRILATCRGNPCAAFAETLNAESCGNLNPDILLNPKPWTGAGSPRSNTVCEESGS